MDKLRPAIREKAVKMRKEPQKSRKNAAKGAAKTKARIDRPNGADGGRNGAIAAEAARLAYGRLVRSNAGHDKGTYLVIVGVRDEDHVLVADGKLRTVGKPKLKKLRHLTVTERESGEIRRKLEEDLPIQDAELRRFIASCTADMPLEQHG